MTVKEIVLAAATELGILDTVNAYLSGTSTDGEAEANALLRCFNLVENEVALDYLPLIAEEEVVTKTGVIYYSSLSREAARVLGVWDGAGNAATFKLFGEYLKTQPDRVRVRYTYIPSEKTFRDDSDFALRASVRLFAYGIAAEYSLASGLFEEAAVWDRKYKEAIKAAYCGQPIRRIRSRRWA
ncbi:MAG: hypothetical protein J6B56_06180 [Clostridia bacterium]|nr:hypothetical protein [Clostridia bacterium]